MSIELHKSTGLKNVWIQYMNTPTDCFPHNVHTTFGRYCPVLTKISYFYFSYPKRFLKYFFYVQKHLFYA